MRDAQIKSILMTADTVGGVWTFATDLAKGLEDYDVKVLLVTMGKEPDDKQKQQIANLSNLLLIDTPFKLEWMDSPWEDVKKAGEFLLDLELCSLPDVIHLNGFCHAALPFKTPVLVTGHSCVYSWFDAVNKNRPPAKNWQRYFLETTKGLQSADLVTAPTSAMLRELNRFYGSFGNSKVIYNGSDVEPFDRKKENFVLSAGRLWDEAKNIEGLQRAADKIEWPVFIAGQDQHPNGKKTTFNKVVPLGMLEKAELIDCMSRASIFSLPAKYEPFGLCILEAALCGCALVIGDIRNLREIWDDAAIYVDPDDQQQLANKINMLINNPELVNYYSHKAKQRAKMYTLEKMTSKYLSLYRYLASEKAGLTNINRLEHESDKVTIENSK